MKTIELKTTVTTKENKSVITKYYISELTEEQYDKIIEANKKGELEECSLRLNINCSKILLIGDTPKATLHKLTPFIDKWKGRNIGEGREDHFRDYGRAKEKQQEYMHLVNTISDIRSSYRTLIRQIKTSHCCIWTRKF